MERYPDKHTKMTHAPVNRLILSLSVPTILSMLISSFYNMADTFFVGQLGTSATGGVGVVFPLMAIFQAVGYTLGHGSGNYMSRKLGQKDNSNASRMASTGFYSALILGVVVLIVGEIFLNQLVSVLGATETILPYAVEYTRYILIGSPFLAASLVINTQLRFQGSAVLGMVGMCSGAVLNIILDPILIFAFDMGITGAAVATAFSQALSFFILLRCCYLGENLRPDIRLFSPKIFFYKEIARGGMPSFFRQFLSSISVVILNTAARPYGDAAIAAMSVVSRVMFFMNSSLIGFGQGFQPVCGFNYGAKLYSRVREGFWFCVKSSLGVLLIFSAVGIVFAPEIVALFRRDDFEVIAIGAKALIFQCCTFPLMSWVIITNMMLQTIGFAAKASLLSCSRQGLFFIPAVLILASRFGITGIQLSQPISDIFAFVMALVLGIGALRVLKNTTPHEEELKT